MSTLFCQVCLRVLMCVDDPEVEGRILDLHRHHEHPDVLPWACETCFYIPPGIKAVRCTDIHDGVCCPMYHRRPAWLG